MEHRVDLSYWDPRIDCYRSKKTHEIIPDSESDAKMRKTTTLQMKKERVITLQMRNIEIA